MVERRSRSLLNTERATDGIFASMRWHKIVLFERGSHYSPISYLHMFVLRYGMWGVLFSLYFQKRGVERVISYFSVLCLLQCYNR